MALSASLISLMSDLNSLIMSNLSCLWRALSSLHHLVMPLSFLPYLGYVTALQRSICSRSNVALRLSISSRKEGGVPGEGRRGGVMIDEGKRHVCLCTEAPYLPILQLAHALV